MSLPIVTQIPKPAVKFTLIIPVLVLLASACAPYKIDVQQGNYLTQKEISKLNLGMSKREVRYVLGTPLIIDPFHDNRWEYYYSFRGKKKSEQQKRRVTVVFTGDEVSSIQGDDDIPSAAAESTGGTKITEAPDEKKKGIFKRTIEKIKGTDSAQDEY